MLYSSGTTGRPKAVRRPLPEDGQGSWAQKVLEYSLAQRYDMTPSSVYLSPAPLYHAAGVNYTMAVHRVGAASILMRKFDAEAVLRLIEEHRRHARAVRADHVRADAQAARRCPREVRRLEPAVRHPCCRAVPGRRQASDDGVVRPDHPRVLRGHRGIRGHDHRSRGVARASRIRRQAVQPGARRRRGRDGAPAGESGELYFEGGPAFEYFKDPAKTASVSNDRGWRSLGDMGYLDEDGYLYLTDRSTFMIVSGGVNIYPQEAENLLVMHPKLVDAAVFGVPNDEFGEEVKAVVQPVDGVAGGTRTRGRTHRVLPSEPRHVQVSAHGRIRCRTAARSERQALQAAHPRALLAGPDVPHPLISRG